MTLFCELIQVALGQREKLSRNPTEEEWLSVYLECTRQAVVGLVFAPLEYLGKHGQKPPTLLLLEWFGLSEQIKSRNEFLNQQCREVSEIFTKEGRRCCVLKGQGIGLLYPNPLLRQSGDIDLWVEGSRESTLSFLKSKGFEMGQVVIHHVDVEILNDVETEIHFIPGYVYNPFLHRRVQHFFQAQAATQFSHYDKDLGFAYPTARFNAVYILSHIYMHFLYEGIGLRQLIDYYYVLKNMIPTEREEAKQDIKDVGFCRFAGAVMYVLHVVCGLEESCYVCAPDKKRGKVLLNEIIRSGNLGKYDERLQGKDTGHLIRNNLIAFRRQLSFLRYYPFDILCIPFWKVWHWCWRKRKGYI